MGKHLASLVLVFLAGAFLAVRPASATILWDGGEDSDFICTGTCGVSAGYFNAVYARESIGTAQGGLTDPPASYLSTPTFTAGSTLWFHAYVQFHDSWGANGQFIRVLSPDGIARIILRGSGTDAKFKISTRNAAGTITDLATMAGTGCPVNTPISLDLYINYAVAGEVTLYCNGTSVADYIGDVTTNSVTQLNQVQLSGNTNGEKQYSEVIVATTDTRNKHLVTVKPVANGNTMAWTGVVGSINPLSYNDSNNISSTTGAQIAEFTIPSLPAGNYSIDAVSQSARATASLTGPQNLQFDVRTGGTDYQSANQLLTLAFTSGYYHVWSTNPNTGVAWTPGDLGAAGLNLGVESQN